MPAHEHARPTEVESNAITLDELIRDQLAGKVVALARYDQIIWKIRAGYVAVLYGMLTFFVGKEAGVSAVLGNSSTFGSLLRISLSLSVCAFLIDVAFVLSKLRVVATRNRLSDIAIQRAGGHKLQGREQAELADLLHLSGEALKLPPVALLVAGLWPLLVLYPVTPLAIWLAFP